MSFRIRGLEPQPFLHLYDLPDRELASLGVQRHVASAYPGYPDRVELRDAQPGETLLLLNYTHQPAATPYRASHAIFVLEGATQVCELLDQVPEVIRRRPISLRAFDTAGNMVDAELLDGAELERGIGRLFEICDVDYIQAHYALRGCYAARIERA